MVVNHAICDFADRFRPGPASPRRWTRPLDRRRRVLYLSSPIGLGHARRDLAIADELRKLHPDLQVDWLAQHPVTELLARRGERIHPASAFLASESRHLEAECAEHDLHVFQAARRMDEIMISNFMVFSDLVASEHYDLWVGDEAWDVDYFLHENPELKRAPYAWLTDFVGWLPMPDGGDSEAALTADYNAEMIEQIGRFPRLRDRAVFVGNPGDVVPDTFGADLPPIRDWVERHYQFAGYISGYDPAAVADTAAIRTELGYRPDEKVCLVTVGGSGVGADLLRRAVAAYPAAKQLVPGLRMGPVLQLRMVTRKAAAICPVDRPQTDRRVRATRAETSSAGWQHKNMRLRVSAARGEASCPVPDSLASRIEAASLVPRMASRRRRSRALWRATPMSQPRALSGTPVDGHCSRAATHASCTASSAAPRSPVRRHTVATAAHQCLRISSSSAALTPAPAPPRSGGPRPRHPWPRA